MVREGEGGEGRGGRGGTGRKKGSKMVREGEGRVRG